MRLRLVFNMREEIAEVFLRRFRRRVAAVEDGVDEHVLRTQRNRRVDETVKMRLHRVNTAIRQQSRQVNRAALFHGIYERLIRLQLVPRNRFADARDVLFDDSARSDIEMSDLGIAHLIARQTDRAARGLERRPGRLAKQPVEARRIRLGDRVRFDLLPTAKAVEDDQD